MRPLATVLSAASTMAAVLVAILWLVGRLLTDRLPAIQVLYWIPEPAYLLLTLFLGLSGWFLAPAQPRRRRARWIAAGSAVLITGHMLFTWHAQRWILPDPQPAGPTINLVQWNMYLPSGHGWPKMTRALGELDPRPDALFLTNPVHGQRFAEAALALGPGYDARRFGPLAVVSRFAIVQFSGTTLGLADGPTDDDPFIDDAVDAVVARIDRLPPKHDRYDPGYAAYAVLDTTEILGRMIVVWMVDLPSDTRRSRWAVASAAADQLWAGDIPFPSPDLIVGDFNIPRGSASLRLIARGMTHAFDQAGCGYAATWPRRWPITQIDHIFLAPTMRAWRYRVLDMGRGRHRLQSARIGPMPSGRRTPAPSPATP